MPIYSPIPTQPRIQASLSDLLDFKWRNNGVEAVFVIPDISDSALRVVFGRPSIVRLLDEMALSTENEDGPNTGYVMEHFAYRVEQTRFWMAQSEAFKTVFPTAKHYRFITGWTCLDVISDAIPEFLVTARHA